MTEREYKIDVMDDVGLPQRNECLLNPVSTLRLHLDDGQKIGQSLQRKCGLGSHPLNSAKDR